ncbi:MAG: class I SAM-dependent methyltransferase [Acidobacteria bacterium]|nr:class I SAM-dependent methyltransferase [Acidobacteriota bacterium]
MNWKRLLRRPPPGCVDACGAGFVEGWAWDARIPDGPVHVEIFDDKVLIGTAPANGYREDLLAAGIGNGVHGFRFALPGGATPRAVRVVIAGTGIELPGAKTRPRPVPGYYRRFTPLLEHGLWCVDDISLSPDALRFAGWALRPPSASACTFLVNGRPCREQRFPLPRDDVHRRFPYLAGAERTGFQCTADVLPSDAGVFELAFAESGEYNQYFTVDDLPLPEPERRQRVHGNRDEGSFRLEGFSAYCKLEQALRRFGRSFDDCPRILDWGCGCGRVTRYFHRQGIHGVDIDADNIEWCRRNLPAGTFETIPMHPPAAAPAGRFPVIIGISVFTHLRQAVMLEWLEWLRRALEPGGLALVSVHGDTAWARSAASPLKLYRKWRKRGILDDFPNADLESVLAAADRSYYRSTFHTREYVQSTWSRYFEILDVLPGYIGNLQDLVIMRYS